MGHAATEVRKGRRRGSWAESHVGMALSSGEEASSRTGHGEGGGQTKATSQSMVAFHMHLGNVFKVGCCSGKEGLIHRRKINDIRSPCTTV